MALSYSSRWEIAEAVRNITANVIDGDLRESFINEEVVARHLETWDCPDPDLLIRTGGELRISNFLLWQCAYSELYFSPVYWPEFREPELVEAIRDYQSRERRFGKTSKQVSNSSN
jgi:undecaprenyl diphosphate synthase